MDVDDVDDDVSEGRKGSGLLPLPANSPRAKSQEDGNWCDSLIVDSFDRKRSNRWRSGFPLDAVLLAKANKVPYCFHCSRWRFEVKAFQGMLSHIHRTPIRLTHLQIDVYRNCAGELGEVIKSPNGLGRLDSW